MKIEKFKVLLYLKKSGLDKNGKAPIMGRTDSYVNHCLLWLNMLMYKAVDRSIIRFNPIAKIGYEKKAVPKMTHISKADFIKMLSTPMADERTELARRCFIFASLTSLSYIDVKKLYPHHISENSEGRKFIRKEREKTGVEFFVPLHPIAEKNIRKNDRISYDVYSLELVITVAFRIDSIESRAFREFIMQAIIKKQTNRPKLVCLWSKNIMV